MTITAKVSFYQYTRTARPTWLQNAITAAGQELNYWFPIPNTRLRQDADHSGLYSSGLWSAGGATGWGYPWQIMSYSGGALRKYDSRLMIHGGGGPPSTWAGNDVRSLCLQTNTPAWDVLVAPAPPIVPGVPSSLYYPDAGTPSDPGAGYLKDGTTPNTGHTNRQCQFVSRLNTFFNFTRAQVWPRDDGNYANVDSISLNNGAAWNTKGTNPSAPNYNVNYEWSTCQDISENVYLTGASDFKLYKFVPDWAGQPNITHPTIPSGQFSVVGAAFGNGNLRGANSSLLIAANDKYVFAMDPNYPPGDPQNRTFSIYWTVPGSAVSGLWAQEGTAQAATVTGSGVAQINWPLVKRNGLVWDNGLKAFLYFQDDGATCKLFSITPTFSYPAAPTFTMEPMTIGGTFLPGSDRSNIYGRMQYVPNLRGVVIAGYNDSNVYFVKTVAG